MHGLEARAWILRATGMCPGLVLQLLATWWIGAAMIWNDYRNDLTDADAALSIDEGFAELTRQGSGPRLSL